jgi:hypothetical protein
LISFVSTTIAIFQVFQGHEDSRTCCLQLQLEDGGSMFHRNVGTFHTTPWYQNTEDDGLKDTIVSAIYEHHISENG